MPRPNDVRESETQVYTCRVCGQEMPVPQPRGLQGQFAHVRCEGPETEVDIYGVLNASYLG